MNTFSRLLLFFTAISTSHTIVAPPKKGKRHHKRSRRKSKDSAGLVLSPLAAAGKPPLAPGKHEPEGEHVRFVGTPGHDKSAATDFCAFGLDERERSRSDSSVSIREIVVIHDDDTGRREEIIPVGGKGMPIVLARELRRDPDKARSVRLAQAYTGHLPRPHGVTTGSEATTSDIAEALDRQTQIMGDNMNLNATMIQRQQEAQRVAAELAQTSYNNALRAKKIAYVTTAATTLVTLTNFAWSHWGDDISSWFSSE